MGYYDKEQLLRDVFTKDRWMVPLERFIQVLRINLFIVDSHGSPVIHPCEMSRSEEYGCRILTRVSGLDVLKENGNQFIKSFSPFGEYFEYKSNLSLNAFAIPLNLYGRVVAYLVVGPVVMNKRLGDEEYLALADKYAISQEGLLDEIRGIRAVSYVAMNGILDLLSAIASDFIEIGLENRRLKKARLNKELLPEEITQAAQGMYKQIHLDELLVSVLDVALNLTGAEAGSIMVFEKNMEDMMIRVSRGLSDEWVKNARVKIGEGVSGMAAKENRCYILHGQQGSEEIKPFLNRPDIKEAIVLPIAHHNRVYGVINLHSKRDNSRIEDNSGYLVGLSKLVSTAVTFH